MSLLAHLAVLVVVGQVGEAAETDCITCHTKVTPGIVGDWKNHFDEATLRRFVAVAGPLLAELGYLENTRQMRRAA